MATTVDDNRQVSCVLTKSLLEYVRSLGYDASSLIEKLSYTEEYLEDTHNYISLYCSELICQRAVDLVKDETVMYQVGVRTSEVKPVGSFKTIIKVFGGPEIAYKNASRWANFFNKSFTFEAKINNNNQATVTMTKPDLYPMSKNLCYYAQGILASIPTLWGLPLAKIHEKRCICQANGRNDEGKGEVSNTSCQYEVTWQTFSPWYSKILYRIFGHLKIRMIKDLEDQFRLLDIKNSELVLRNSQLAKVREIALAIDKVRTKEQVYIAVVELARDIPGVGFVIMLKGDETKESVTAPYFSKIRNKAITAALRGIGFNLETVMGRESNSGKFKFSVSQSKIVQDFVKNPRVIAYTSLARIMEGIWPKILCDSIQKIAGIDNIVAVPIIVDGDTWGSILFYLSGNVPLDILEMVGAHCVTAIKNVANIENLEQLNRELVALNTISKETASSLNLQSLLVNVIGEIARIFASQAVAIYLLGENKQTLELISSYGMLEQIVKDFKYIPLEKSMIGAYFKSEEDTVSGDLREYKATYPTYASLSRDDITFPFVVASLKNKQGRCGLVALVRENGLPFNSREVVLLQSVANQISVAIENAGLHSDIHSRMDVAERAQKDLKEIKKNLENALTSLSESERKYRLIAENTVDHISLLDSRGFYKYLSPSYKKLGYDERDLLGRSKLDLIHFEDRERFLSMFNKYNKMNASELTGLGDETISESIYYRLVDKIGKWHDFEAGANFIVDPNNKSYNILLISRDITERKRAEEKIKESELKFRSIFDNANDGILVIKFETKKIYTANKAMCQMLGYSLEELIELQIADIHPEKDLKQVIACLEEHYKGLLTHSIDIPFKRKDGSTFYTEVNSSSLALAGRNYLVGFFRDITKQRQMEEERQRVSKLESVGTLAGGLAHDFNNILTGIMGNIQLANVYLEQNEPVTAKELLVEAERASMRAKNLTQQLLTFSKGGAPIKKVMFVNRLIRESAIFALRGSQVKSEFAIPDTLWAVEADEGQLNQVISNLVINADQAMPKGGTINIKASNVVIEKENALTLPEGNYIEIAIKDHGIGIPKEHKGNIFNPYFTTKQKGSGLGLATSYSIIKSHSGQITFESELGTGTTFQIYLPATKEKINKEREELPTQPLLRAQGRILVMDDEEAIRLLLGRVLKSAGYEVEVTRDGAEAIQKYTDAKKSGKPFDAVILDLTVPGGMGGKEVIGKLLEIDPEVKAIVSSGYATDPIMANYKEYGFSGVVTKPYYIEYMKKTLNQLLTSNK